MASNRQHETALGQYDRPNLNLLYDKVLAKDTSLGIEWVYEESRDKDGNGQWTTTLIVRLPDGAVETYIGVGAKKGHSKDAAASDYLIANGFMLPNPSVG